MHTPNILSLIVPPFPTFIEGNITSYRVGQKHPNRNNLPYFDILFVTEGSLAITEEGIEYIVEAGEMLILCPYKHHFAHDPCDKPTKFYWIHFYYEGVWRESDSPITLSSNVIIPNLHFHNEDYTLHLKKHQQLSDSKYILELLERLLLGTKGEKKSIVFWDNQKRFSQLLKALEEQSYSKNRTIQIAEKIEMYIKKNYQNNLTNAELAEHFHFHENYLIRCMKSVFNCTPLEYHSHYKLEKAANLLIKTNASITTISNDCGFQSPAYFSLCFKKKFSLSPLAYRNSHSGS